MKKDLHGAPGRVSRNIWCRGRCDFERSPDTRGNLQLAYDLRQPRKPNGAGHSHREHLDFAELPPRETPEAR